MFLNLVNRGLALALLLVGFTFPAQAREHDDNDRAAFGSDITVAEGDSASDIACAFCSVHVRGEVTGDVAVFWGSVVVEPGHAIAGDVAIAAGDLNLGEGATVSGDVAMVGGDARISEGAAIHGDKAIIPPPLGTLILFSPLIVLVLLIWLSVYLIRRSRYRFPVYPHGHGVPPTGR